MKRKYQNKLTHLLIYLKYRIYFYFTSVNNILHIISYLLLANLLLRTRPPTILSFFVPVSLSVSLPLLPYLCDLQALQFVVFSSVLSEALRPLAFKSGLHKQPQVSQPYPHSLSLDTHISFAIAFVVYISITISPTHIHIRHFHSLSSAHSLHYECNVQSLSLWSLFSCFVLCFLPCLPRVFFFCIAFLISAFTLSRFSFCLPAIFNCTVSLFLSLCLPLSLIYTLLE